MEVLENVFTIKIKTEKAKQLIFDLEQLDIIEIIENEFNMDADLIKELDDRDLTPISACKPARVMLAEIKSNYNV
jgi:hypothetical protein